MRYKLILAFALAFAALAPLPAPVRRVEARTGPTVGVYCIPLGRNRLECHATVDGGTSPYAYQWSPTPLAGGGEIAIIYCYGNQTRTISVTVTDADSNTGSFSDNFFCCGSCDPW
jgi:hypothetical protein